MLMFAGASWAAAGLKVLRINILLIKLIIFYLTCSRT